jgi:UDP-N-acetylmuramate--alanine ligase
MRRTKTILMNRAGTRIHFIGIGGIGVSAVARVALGRDCIVSGSDVRRSALTDAMVRAGARVTIGHAPENLDGVDLVVVSTAIPDHNVELRTAHERGIPTIHRSELLAEFLATPITVGVTGTHGKGTTAAMITRILDAAGREPGFIIGGMLVNYGLNADAGGGEVMVAEVDESDGSHANVPVTHLVCNYLEADHLNYYKDRDDIIESMAAAVNGNPRLEHLFVNSDCDGNRRLMELVDTSVTTYGVETEADYSASIVGAEQLPIRFRITERGVDAGEFSLPLPGLYNVVNALGAVAVARSLGVDFDAIREGLSDFRGLENRFTIVQAGGVAIVKDYNSHPTAIRKVLESARHLTDGKLYSVFKPYRYTLTSYLKDEYAKAFEGSHEIVITTMYAANEDPIPGIDTEFVVEMLRREGHSVVHLPNVGDVVPYLESVVESGDKVLFFGGDDFFALADDWAERLESGRSHR